MALDMGELKEAERAVEQRQARVAALERQLEELGVATDRGGSGSDDESAGESDKDEGEGEGKNKGGRDAE
jgi:hypothetical protein